MGDRADRFPLMDSLRAIAVIAVLLTHASYFVAQTGTGVLRHLRFDMGVTIFFVISGFLIYRPWVRARLRGEPSPLVRVYAWRRFLRIVPGYWVALTVVTLVVGLVGLFSWSWVYWRSRPQIAKTSLCSTVPSAAWRYWSASLALQCLSWSPCAWKKAATSSFLIACLLRTNSRSPDQVALVRSRSLNFSRKSF